MDVVKKFRAHVLCNLATQRFDEIDNSIAALKSRETLARKQVNALNEAIRRDVESREKGVKLSIESMNSSCDNSYQTRSQLSDPSKRRHVTNVEISERTTSFTSPTSIFQRNHRIQKTSCILLNWSKRNKMKQ